jgi:hypothetical protein
VAADDDIPRAALTTAETLVLDQASLPRIDLAEVQTFNDTAAAVPTMNLDPWKDASPG